VAGAIHLVEQQAALLISVATGGPQFKAVEGQYQERRDILRRVLRRWGVEYPFPWRSLWEWHGAYSSKYPHYQQRRAHIRELADVAIRQLEVIQDPALLDIATSADESTSIERRIGEMRNRLGTARTLDDFQDVGRRAREVLIAAVNEVFDEAMAKAGQEVPKRSDAKARFDLVTEARFAGSARAEMRAFMRTAWDLAAKVTHGGSEDRLAAVRQDAVAAAQASLAIARVLSEMKK
jgi:hypothetical protein